MLAEYALNVGRLYFTKKGAYFAKVVGIPGVGKEGEIDGNN